MYSNVCDRELKSKQLYSRIKALENVIIEIELHNTRLVVNTIYRSPNSAADNNTCINNLITDMCSHNKVSNLKLGDFNYHVT